MTTTLTIPTLETERLRLRAPRMGDLAAYTAFCASPRSAGVGGPYTAQQAFARLGEVIGHWQLRGYGRWMVADKATDAPLGVVGLMFPVDWPEPEIAWSLFDEAEGKGIAHEAALAARAYAYDVLGWTTAISLIVTSNTRSEALAKRMGATLDRVLQHPQFGPMNVWRHLPPEALENGGMEAYP